MTELELYQFIGHRLPQLPRASGIANRILKPLYNRKLRGPVLSEVSGRKMQLDPRENVDGGLLFCPQLYDYAEIRFLLQTLNDDDVFVDIGAHIGFYSLIASKKIHRGKILAGEANPATYQKLQHNIALNSLPIDAVNVGVSDRKELLKLSGYSNNTAGQSFLIDAPDGVEVQCYPLADILENRGIGNIKAANF